MRSKNIILALSFMGILILPLMNKIFHFATDIESSENRKLKAAPALKVANLDPYPSEYEEYNKEHFFMRNYIQKQWLYLSINTFKTEPTGKALIGTDGWLFAGEKDILTYLGENLFTDSELDDFREEVKERAEYLKSKNCKYVLLIAPIKQSVYPEFLPVEYRSVQKYTRTDQLIDALSDLEDVLVIDLRQTFNRSKDIGTLYRKVDTHWSDLGAFIASTEIVNSLKSYGFNLPDAMLLSDLESETKDQSGNIARLLSAEDRYREDLIFYKVKKQIASAAPKANYEVPPDFPFPWEYEKAYTTPDKELPRLLFIQDSFGSNLRPFLSEYFSKSVFIFDSWQYHLHKDIVENETPDVFIQEILESNLQNFLK